MKIAIDMDEVLADLLTEYIHFVNTKYTLSISQSHFKNYYMWNTWNGTPEQRIALFEEFYQSNYFNKIRPIPKAISNVAKIKKHHDLYVITSRPDHLKAHTVTWIKKHFPDTFSDIFFASHVLNKKKSDICKTIETEVIIEDSVDYALDCVKLGMKVFLIPYPWNAIGTAHKNIIRVNSWDNIPSLLLA